MRHPDQLRVRNAFFVRWLATVLSGVICLLNAAGCATTPYTFGASNRYIESPQLAEITGPQFERGNPNVVLDSVGWVIGIPSKILLLDHRVDNHRVDRATEAEVAAYLEQNQLRTVKVRVNQYHPGDDWKRLVANKSVGAGWRYTLGALSVVGETLLPGRIVGGDHFNPFTNTVHLYSNVPSIGIHEAAHAKDFAQRTWKGTYAAAYLLPGAPLYHEAKATGDAVGYLTATHDVSAQKEALHILYPAYGSYVGNAISGNVPVGYVAGVVGGHIVGRWKAWELGRHPAHSTTRPNVEFQQAAGTQPADEPSRVSHAVDYR